MAGIRSALHGTLHRSALVLACALALAGCGAVSSGGSGPAGPAGSPGSATSSAGGSSMGAAGTDLTIVVDDGRGGGGTWHLTCDPAGGDHPNPAVACAVLREQGARWLPAVPADVACTEIYGGPQTARITGTWEGKPVDARLSKTDGCQIARWNGLSGLLPST